MVIWAGNNEDYMVQERYQLEYDFENKDPEAMLKSTFPARYIYEYWLPKVLGEEDPHMIYHPSSPWGDGKPWADETVGDMHQWHSKPLYILPPSPLYLATYMYSTDTALPSSLLVWHGNMNRYQEVDVLGGRFISEFGMEAYPHLSTLKNVITDSSQHYPGSIAMDAHNKAAGHQRRLGIYLAENFRTGPPVGAVVTPGSELAFFTHLTQILQAETMRYAYKFWRRTWRHGHRHCGGVLVWQLNDCWPTVSWAVVDYHLVRKPGFYAITRALRPIDVGVARTVHDWTQTGEFVDPMSKLKTGQVDHTRPARKGTFDVWIASSKVEAVEAEVTVRFISVSSGKDVHASIIQTITASANTSTDVLAGQSLPPPYPNAEDLATTPFSVAKYDPYVIHATVSIGGQVIAVDTAWPEPLKYLDFPDRGVTFEVSPAGDKLTIAATKPVKGFVVEEMVGLKLSDNGFDLVPGEKQEIKVEGCLKAGELRYTYIGAPSPSMEIK
jgi:beta-mannosidase